MVESSLEGSGNDRIEFGRKRMWLNRIWKEAVMAELNLEGSVFC